MQLYKPSFFLQEEGRQFVYDEANMKVSDNYMDKWVLSFTQSLVKFVHKEMAAYHLYTVMPNLVKFVDELTNWYIRMNRRRLKVKDDSQLSSFLNVFH